MQKKIAAAVLGLGLAACGVRGSEPAEALGVINNVALNQGNPEVEEVIEDAGADVAADVNGRVNESEMLRVELEKKVAELISFYERNQVNPVDRDIFDPMDRFDNPEFRELALAVLRFNPSIHQLAQYGLINLNVYREKLDYQQGIRARIEALGEENKAECWLLEEALRAVEARLENKSNFGLVEFEESLQNGARVIEEQLPLDQIADSLRGYMQFSPEFFEALAVQEHTGDNIEAVFRIQLFRSLIESGYNPYMVVSSPERNLYFGLLQNRAASLSLDNPKSESTDLREMWGAYDRYRDFETERVNPFEDQNIVDMFSPTAQAYELQILANATTIASRLQILGAEVLRNDSEAFQEALRNLEAVQNEDPELVNRFMVVLGAIMNSSRQNTANDILVPVFKDFSPNLQENIDRILEVQDEDDIATRRVRQYATGAYHNYLILTSSSTE